VAEPDAQFAQRAGLLLRTSGFSGSFRHAWFGVAGALRPGEWDKYQLATMAGGDFFVNASLNDCASFAGGGNSLKSMNQLRT
jgi:hypothetical protein